jgi:inhibitor of cysteine peptidase
MIGSPVLLTPGSRVRFAAAGALAAISCLSALVAPAARMVVAQGVAGCDVASDPGAIIQAQPGQPVVVAVPANRTTGYSWYLAQPPDPAVLQVAEAVYLPPAPANPPVAGQGGVSCWTFLAVGPGDTVAVFEYRRPFELSQPPANSLSFEVAVAPAQ